MQKEDPEWRLPQTMAASGDTTCIQTYHCLCGGDHHAPPSVAALVSPFGRDTASLIGRDGTQISANWVSLRIVERVPSKQSFLSLCSFSEQLHSSIRPKSVTCDSERWWRFTWATQLHVSCTRHWYWISAGTYCEQHLRRVGAFHNQRECHIRYTFPCSEGTSHYPACHLFSEMFYHRIGSSYATGPYTSPSSSSMSWLSEGTGNLLLHLDWWLFHLNPFLP